MVDDGNVWAACLKGISTEQIKSGLNKCATRNMEWPPSAPQFRGMCLGIEPDEEGNDVAWQQRNQAKSVHEALGYVPKALTDMTAVERVKQKGKAEIAKIKEQFGF